MNSKISSLVRPTDTSNDDVPRSLPPWLVSLVLHLMVFLALVLIPNHQLLISGISLTGTFGPLEGDASFELESDSQDDSMMDMAQESQMEAISTETPAPVEVPEVTKAIPLAVEGIESLDKQIEIGLSGRSAAMRDALLKAYGGTQGTQDAVELGLQWLVKQQQPDGSWSLVKPYSSAASVENRPAATAMAMLALLGAGHTHLDGKYRENVKKGLYYLKSRQNERGYFATGLAHHQQAYAQAQCMIVVCELYAMTKDQALKILAEESVNYALYAQSAEGGWRYDPKVDSDVSITGWFLMGLISAKAAGISVPGGVTSKISDFLDTVQWEKGALYAYHTQDRGPRLTMTAEGLLCRQYLGWRPYEQAMQDGAEALLENPIRVSDDLRDFYYWYYATQVLHHMGGEHWAQWNASMREALPAMQIKAGKEAGSWAPIGEQWAAHAGRLYSTCFSIYCLEVYYRHLPLYDMNK